ncbi:DNA-directed RNA polymerases IV and V subunit 2-like [Gastrolobium bilobum]|uniref:DNA-directed RNA polymerases IV and V subunit 2-like n=1 Tax=Gastrolobium bilobum TaxID=150636 RepID=UPI002AB0ED61|nr:DNA-directed RNA polymerases IV and V subunit 2-like [Gastrolobium bilobum]
MDHIEELGEDKLTHFCKKASMLFFDQYGLISHQINSYNQFISSGLQSTFDSFGDLIVTPGFDPSKKGDHEHYPYASIRFGKVTLDQPKFFDNKGNTKEFKMLPRHARLQRMTYSSQMKVNLQVQFYVPKKVRSDKFKTGKEEHLDKEVLKEDNREIIIGKLPVMVKSDLCYMKGDKKGDCEFDHGGYFLIKGAEKVFIAQEQINTKRLWVSNYPCWKIEYRSQVKRNRLGVKLVEKCRFKEIKVGEKVLTVYFLSVEIPVWILFFGLGVSSDKEIIIDLIDYGNDDDIIHNILFASVRDADEKCEYFRKGKNALHFIEGYVKGVQFPPSESIEECLNMYLFPNIKGLKRKARLLAYMVKGLLLAYTGRRKCDNKNDFRNKRLDLAGELLERELKRHIEHARKQMAKALQRDLYGDREVCPIEHYLDASIITNGLQRAFSTGQWSHPYKRLERISGVVENLGRTNPLQTVAELRRTRQQVQYAGKAGDATYPHPSHWGKVCFLTTSDGKNCELVKNLAVTGLVSTNITGSVLPQLFDCGMEELVEDTSTCLGNKDKVFLNGDWVGVCSDSISFVAELRSKRRRNELPHQVEIKRDQCQQEVRIYSDAGRILRPLLVVGNLHKIKGYESEHYSFQSLLDDGVVELVGPEEEEDCLTAWGVLYLFSKEDNSSVKFTHCELDMSFLLSLSCSLVPFANHDQARRVLLQSQKHSSQAIGFSTTNPDIRVDILSQQLYYPQKPLFLTMTSDCLGKPGYPLGQNRVLPIAEFYKGQNAIVAVNVHLGYNQEDSIVMNRASLQRGMFRSEHIRSYKAEIENKESLVKMRKPEDVVKFGKIESRIGRVDSVDDDGFPYVGANLQSGDIIIARCTESGVDHSIKLKHSERGYVQKVALSSNEVGKNFAVVSLRQVRSPVVGDKFSSMHGQKGVLGFLESQENFPFTTQGIVPDIVINPHAFPSRQTPGQLLEAALGKGIARGGLLRHATPYSTPSVDVITDQLHRAGFSRWGKERVYNGRTGEMVGELIFMGPTFYQRLGLMSEDQLKFRNTGPVHPVTRQPVKDKKRFGGVNFGEMERDCLIGHGASANLYERLFTLSDSSQIHVCRKCRNVANVILRRMSGGHNIRGPYCRLCESVDDIVVASVPYGAKLLCQELFSMGINLKFDSELC